MHLPQVLRTARAPGPVVGHPVLRMPVSDVSAGTADRQCPPEGAPVGVSVVCDQPDRDPLGVSKLSPLCALSRCAATTPAAARRFRLSSVGFAALPGEPPGSARRRPATARTATTAPPAVTTSGAAGNRFSSSMVTPKRGTARRPTSWINLSGRCLPAIGADDDGQRVGGDHAERRTDPTPSQSLSAASVIVASMVLSPSSASRNADVPRRTPAQWRAAREASSSLRLSPRSVHRPKSDERAPAEDAQQVGRQRRTQVVADRPPIAGAPRWSRR